MFVGCKHIFVSFWVTNNSLFPVVLVLLIAIGIAVSVVGLVPLGVPLALLLYPRAARL
jgi:hypothetical protein